MVVGPTGVGKTAVSIPLAQRLNGEIVSADSRLFYRGMDIGTAKPSPGEMVTVPHHLIDISPPDEQWNLADYISHAQEAIEGIHRRGNIPILVGGTGQYILSILEGWDLPVGEPDHRIRTAIESWSKEIGPISLHRKLAVLDPESARSIDHHNVRRTIRALEVILTSGKKFSSQRQKNGTAYSVLLIGLRRARQELYQIIDHRIDMMVAGGFIGEVQSLLDAGYKEDLPAFSAIGYRQIIQYLRGFTSLEESIQSMRKYTRQYVRRQDTWFKQEDPRIHWLDIGDGVLEEICRITGEKENWILPEKKPGMKF